MYCLCCNTLLTKSYSCRSGVASSFRPTTSAKLYASPEDMKTVGYRSRSLPSHSSRPQVRKSHSMRTSSSFKPVNTSTPPGKNTNPYAQPIRASRSHSTAGKRCIYIFLEYIYFIISSVLCFELHFETETIQLSCYVNNG